LEEGEEGAKGSKNYDRNDGLGTLYDPENGTASDEEQHKADNQPAHPERQGVFLFLLVHLWFHVTISILSSTFWHLQKL
jgi:hypothetical protein